MGKKGVSTKTKVPVFHPTPWVCHDVDKRLNFQKFFSQAMQKAKITQRPQDPKKLPIPIVTMFPGGLSPIGPLTMTGCFPSLAEIACVQPCKAAAWCERHGCTRPSLSSQGPIQCRKLGDLLASSAPSASHGGRMTSVRIPTGTMLLGKLALPSKPHAVIGSTEQNAIDAKAYLQKFQPQAAILDISGSAPEHVELFKTLEGFSVSRARSNTAAFGLCFFPPENLDILLVIRDGLGSAVEAGRMLDQMVCRRPFHVQSFLKGTA